MKKYKLTKNTKEHLGKTLYQIEATTSFGLIEKGDNGGYIEKESNLSMEGNAWIYGDARIYGNARIYGDARISGNAWISGKLKISAGYFFGMRYDKEEIKYHKIPDSNNELIYKGEAKFGEESEDVEITIEGKSKTISRKSAEALNLI